MEGWAAFWQYYLIGVVVAGIGMATVCLLGGIVDLVGFVADLRSEHRKRGGTA